MKTITYKGKIDKNNNGIYREKSGQLILGKSHKIYIHNLDYHLTELKIYVDGMIDCWE